MRALRRRSGRRGLGAESRLLVGLLAALLAQARAEAGPSCKTYGCVAYTPANSCQCNGACEAHSSCCSDFKSVCVAGEDSAHPAAAPAAPVVAVAAVPPVPPEAPRQVRYAAKAESVVNFDMYRAMASPAVDTHDIEDDDMADLGGVIKYLHTEILTEHLGDPLRRARKYDIDVLTRHRYKIRNTDKLLNSDLQAMGEFGQFVTYDWGQATNTAQMDMFHQYGDFVGVQMGCADLHCDPRWPSESPYAWFSVGNWCPNLPWDKKGSKVSPSPECLRDTEDNLVRGGLCPGGFDPASFIPVTEPTGQPGCVYSYGKAMVLSLDDLAGITKYDCNGRTCTSWLHFRQNCTDPSLRRRFLPTGQIEKVDFCVEFDIHPVCEANCESPQCQALIESGQEVYLGVPWWSGRCDPRANTRRMEQVAAAFGIGGALTSHEVVDETILDTAEPCPRAKGSSWSCAPEIAGMAGPLCTRNFNGACQQCYIPGTEQGPNPAPKPWCPLDTFAKAPYTDKLDFPPPKCRSSKATDGCCLYTSNCTGSSDPQSATLDDEGFALVASRRNSADMEAFLRRAAAGTATAGAVGNQDALKWAAYYAWDRGPVSRTLSETMAELMRFGKQPATSAPVVTSSSATEVQNDCFELAVSFMPLDMEGTIGGMADSAKACQQRCAAQAGCRHFSFLQNVGAPTGFCHLHDLLATAQLGSVGFVSGPYECWSDLKDTSNLIDKGHKTFVTPEFACMDWGTTYASDIPLGSKILAAADGNTEQAVLQCQRACAETEGCGHFAFSLPARLCGLASPAAMRMDNVMGAISGPPACGRESKAAFYRLYADGRRAPARLRGQASTSSALGAAVCLLAVASLAALKVMRLRRPAYAHLYQAGSLRRAAGAEDPLVEGL